MTQKKRNSLYHFLGAFAWLSPVMGLAAPAIYYLFRKYPSIEEKNHYRGVMNFLITYYLLGIIVYTLLPEKVFDIGFRIWALVAMTILLLNGMRAFRGMSVFYPFSISICRPLKETHSVEEMMHSSRADNA